MDKKTFYITTTLPYVNAPLHMGHALEFVRADAIVRYKKALGYDVFFNTGTDEHGVKIYTKAIDQGKTPQEFVDEGFSIFKEQVSLLGVDLNETHFVRTTDEVHKDAVTVFWKKVMDNGYIYKKNYQTKYCVGCESDKTDSELDSEGFCPIHPGIALELIDEENYFFKYSEFGERLLKFYENNPHFIIPTFRFNEMKEFIKRGLQDFSISRVKEKMPWGIPVPGDDNQVIYVWFDALINYIATLGWPNIDGDFKKYWIDGSPTQYCGKDNTRFQGIMWQAMLMAADVPQSHQIVVNGFITGEGGVRMSKTIGNVVDPREIIKEYGTDALRFFLLSEISSFEDSPFTKERFHEVYNAKLANGLGNLTSRIMKMATTHLGARPEINECIFPENFQEKMNSFDSKGAVDIIFEHITKLNTHIQKTEPFKLIKTDKMKAEKIIHDLVLELFTIAYMLAPIMPETSISIRNFIKDFSMPTEPLFLRK